MQKEETTLDHSTADILHRASSSMPPCCGSGCSVCVLDYWTEDEIKPVTEETETGAGEKTNWQSEADTLAMVEAIEEAQWIAEQMIAQMDGETL
jgi:hypothetical protein